MQDLRGPSIWARLMGFGGLIPFVGLSAWLWVAPPGEWQLASLALLGYGAIICTFLGAIHWGLAMREKGVPPVPALLWGVAPSLLAWTALMMGHTPGLMAIAVLLWACFAVDRISYPRYELQAWMPMRLALTLVASASCIVGAAAAL